MATILVDPINPCGVLLLEGDATWADLSAADLTVTDYEGEPYRLYGLVPVVSNRTWTRGWSLVGQRWEFATPADAAWYVELANDAAFVQRWIAFQAVKA